MTDVLELRAPESQSPGKSGIERMLITVRAHVTNDLLQDKVAREEEGRPGKARCSSVHRQAREELEQAEQVSRSAELQHSHGVRLGQHSNASEAITVCAETSKCSWCGSGCSDQDLYVEEGDQELGAERPRTSCSSRRSATSSRGVQERLERVREVAGGGEVARILERCGHLDFDALALAANPQAGGMVLSILGSHLVRKHDLVCQLEDRGMLAGHGAFEQALVGFFGKMDRLYKSEAVYHNAAHAADVTATTEWLMRSQYMRARTTQLDHFMSLVASVIHDVGHPGRNNLFHTKTMSPLAIRYSDKSILESMHIALAFETMQSDPGTDWFSQLARVVPGQAGAHDLHLQHYVRKGLVAMVLATDMAKHSTHVQELKSFVQEQEELDISPEKPADKQKALARTIFLLETVIHAADISNPCKPRGVMLGWTRRVLQEFWSQGDEELRLGLEVSPLCDRAAGSVAVPKGQLGFISFFVQPFFDAVAVLIAEAKEATEALERNKAFWQGKDEALATYGQIFPDSA